MKRIHIGNDFRVRWELTQLGEAFDLVGKTYDIEVSSPYGVIIVTDVVAEGNILSFSIPASQQVYLGSYNITLTITSEAGQSWRLQQCDAFCLISCECGCDTDVTTVVQLSSGIVYPANGLSAYELAVINGYKGTYEEWVKWYATPQIEGATDNAELNRYVVEVMSGIGVPMRFLLEMMGLPVANYEERIDNFVYDALSGYYAFDYILGFDDPETGEHQRMVETVTSDNAEVVGGSNVEQLSVTTIVVGREMLGIELYVQLAVCGEVVTEALSGNVVSYRQEAAFCPVILSSLSGGRIATIAQSLDSLSSQVDIIGAATRQAQTTADDAKGVAIAAQNTATTAQTAAGEAKSEIDDARHVIYPNRVTDSDAVNGVVRELYIAKAPASYKNVKITNVAWSGSVASITISYNLFNVATQNKTFDNIPMGVVYEIDGFTTTGTLYVYLSTPAEDSGEIAAEGLVDTDNWVSLGVNPQVEYYLLKMQAADDTARLTAEIIRSKSADDAMSKAIESEEAERKSDVAFWSARSKAYYDMLSHRLDKGQVPKLVYKQTGKDDYIISDTPIADTPSLLTYDETLEDVIVCDCQGMTTLVDVFGGYDYASNRVPNRPIYSIAISNTDSLEKTGFSHVFASLYYLAKIDLSKVTSLGNVDRMLCTFYGCRSLERIDMSTVDMSNIRYISQAFSELWACKEIVFPQSLQNVTQLGNLLCYNSKGLERIDLSMVTSQVTHAGYSNFGNCTSLKYIDIRNADFSGIRYSQSENPTVWSSTFYNCVSLEEYYGGRNMKLSYSLADSPRLTKESALHCIDNLYDFVANGDAPTNYTPTLTLHNDVVSQLTDEEIALATAKGWTIA